MATLTGLPAVLLRGFHWTVSKRPYAYALYPSSSTQRNGNNYLKIHVELLRRQRFSTPEEARISTAQRVKATRRRAVSK